MASLREIRRKIKSVKSTEQITKAMKMVAAARMRRSQQAIIASRPFAIKLDELARGLAEMERAAAAAAGQAAPLHPLLDVSRGDEKRALILITGDKGLCGAFNSNVIRAAIGWFKKNQDKKLYVIPVGRKAKEFVSRLRGFKIKVLTDLTGIFPKISFAHAELIGKAAIEAFEEEGLGSVTVL